MRVLLILGGIGILGAAAWAVTADEGGHGHGSSPGAYGQGGLEVHMRHGGGHTGHIGLLLPTQLALGEPEPGPVAPEMIMAGLVGGGPEHMVAVHPVGPAIHPLAQVPLRVVLGEAVSPQSTDADAAGSDDGVRATAQPNPDASPSTGRPPGAGGPGRPVSGWSGPGRPGPGRPALSRR
jgi:hypothetical protein